MLRIGTLFSGVGTPELALKHLEIEHETLFACEIDKYARITYLENNKEPNTFYEDIYELDGKKYEDQLDILIGGSPCQSFSIAGKRKGVRDARGNLIYEYFRIVEEAKPKVFVYENVKGFTSIDKGETFKTFTESFVELGYDINYDILNTKDYGIPQNRERIYIVGFSEESNFTFSEKEELKLKLKDMLEQDVDAKYYLKQELVEKYHQTGTASNHKGSQAGKVVDADKEPNFHTLTAGSHGYANGYIKLKHTHNYNIKGNDSIKRIYSEEGLCPALTTMGGGHREPKVAISFAQRGRYNEDGSTSQRLEFRKDEVANSITTVQKDSMVKDGLIFRKLTPRECFRLQGFDDSFKFPHKMSNTQLYKQAGNGMSRNILEMIFKQILKERRENV